MLGMASIFGYWHSKEIRERLRKPTKQGFSTWVENRVGTREYTRSVGCGRGMREVEEMISLPICGCGLAN